MEWLQTRIAQSPKAAQIIGHALFGVGGLLIVAGLIARAGLLAINTARARGNLPTFPSVGEAYPNYPLWFVPEGPFGYIIAAVLAGLGIYIALSAKSLLKSMRGVRQRR